MALKDSQEELYTPTFFQRTIDNPLSSEQRINALLPRLLSHVDMLVIFIANVIYIPNVGAIQGAGPPVYFYWIIGTVTFLVPSALVAAQLNRFMPVDGAIYVWTHRALGPLWGFFAGFCAWFPGILLLFASGNVIITILQGICVQLWKSVPYWLTTPWQQGIIVLGILLLAGWFANFPLSLIMRLAKGAVALYAGSIFIIGLAGMVWLLSGHAPQVPLLPRTGGLGEENFGLYGIIVLSLLGIEVPLNMAAETRRPDAANLFLRWGPLITLVAYLLGTFGVMVVVPPSVSSSPYSILTAIDLVFGVPMSVLIGIILIIFFFITIILYNITFARILFVSALDHRLPIALARQNRHATPSHATSVQTIIALIIACFTYFLGPVLFQQEGGLFSARVYGIFPAVGAVIWCISMLILFLDLPLLLARFPDLLTKRSGQLIAPTWVLYLCCLLGGIESLLGICTTFAASWDSHLITDDQWRMTVGLVTLVFLILGLLSSAYPRLLSSLEEQTAIARENAHLYQELRTAYAKLSELDQLKDAFLTTASHELRTPVTIVQGYLELLSDMENVGSSGMQHISSEVRQAFLSKACRACDELVVLLSNVMDASRLQFDAASLRITPLPLKSITTAIVELFEPLTIKEQRTISVEIDANLFVMADEARLKQILHNLISNAIRYSLPHTPLHITAIAKEAEQVVQISVRDHGFGIPPDKQNTIFEKFVRLERDMHGTVRGSGLGLFITRQLVETMHGTIRVESTGIESEGSTFSFTLPLPSPSITARKE